MRASRDAHVLDLVNLVKSLLVWGVGRKAMGGREGEEEEAEEEGKVY